MASENELKKYLKLLMKEFESDVLADDVYRTGQLDASLIHQQYNIAVDKFLKNATAHEAGIKDTERIYYRGWISSFQTMMLHLERQERFDQEAAEAEKQREKLEREIEKLKEKNAKLEAKLVAMAEKAKKK